MLGFQLWILWWTYFFSNGLITLIVAVKAKEVVLIYARSNAAVNILDLESIIHVPNLK
jgi:hypothetical protein